MRSIAVFDQEARVVSIWRAGELCARWSVPPVAGVVDTLTDNGYRIIRERRAVRRLELRWLVDTVPETMADAVAVAIDRTPVLIAANSLVRLLCDFAEVADRQAPRAELEDCARSIATARGFLPARPLRMVAL